VGEIRRFPKKKPAPISEEQEERELQEAMRAASAPPKKARTDDGVQEPVPAAHRGSKKKRQPSQENQFYYCPSTWADRAFDVLNSANQVKLAFRLYRRWKTWAEDDGGVVASNVALGIDWRDVALIKTKTATLHILEAAKLIRIEGGGSSRAPRVRILE
jgi:hypothetical protein